MRVIAKAGVRFCTVLAVYVTTSASAHAQSPETGPGPTFTRGPFTLESALGIEALQDSNIFQSATDVRSSQIWEIRPNVLMRFKPGRSRLELGYAGDYGWYDRSGNDDYTDHALRAGAYLLMGDRSGLDVVASYDYAHEDRGTGLTQGYDPALGALPQDPDRYTRSDLLARYTFGVSRTRAYLTLEGSTRALTYQNHEARTREFDRDESYGKATFGLRVRPKTSLELSVQAKDITYDSPRLSGVSQDSREYRYLLGIVWEATARTTGSVRVGQLQKEFDDAARPNFSGPSWEVAIRWSPRTYSHFDLATERHTDEPVDLFGDVTDTAIYSLSWSHEWNDRLGSKLALAEVDSTYRYVTGDRKDKSPRYSLAVTYKMRQWLRLEAGVDSNSRDSGVARYNFDQTVVRLGAWIIF